MTITPERLDLHERCVLRYGELSHDDCLALIAEVRRQSAEIERLRAELSALHAMLDDKDGHCGKCGRVRGGP